MKKIFEKHESTCCIALIVAYVLVNSYAIQNFGITDYRSALINTIFSLILIGLMTALDRLSYYGLNKAQHTKRYLYFIPLMMIATVNLWNGIHINHTGHEILFHTINMINVGFIEEIIFRGFLFRMIEKESLKKAILISSLTFGIGHIVNLFNGAELIPTIAQICYAIAIGFAFVMVFHTSQSLWPCILTHILINATSIFNIENNLSVYIAPPLMMLISLGYALYLVKLDQKQ